MDDALARVEKRVQNKQQHTTRQQCACGSTPPSTFDCHSCLWVTFENNPSTVGDRSWETSTFLLVHFCFSRASTHLIVAVGFPLHWMLTMHTFPHNGIGK